MFSIIKKLAGHTEAAALRVEDAAEVQTADRPVELVGDEFIFVACSGGAGDIGAL